MHQVPRQRRSFVGLQQMHQPASGQYLATGYDSKRVRSSPSSAALISRFADFARKRLCISQGNRAESGKAMLFLIDDAKRLERLVSAGRQARGEQVM
jgi:hypothetical protein